MYRKVTGTKVNVTAIWTGFTVKTLDCCSVCFILQEGGHLLLSPKAHLCYLLYLQQYCAFLFLLYAQTEGLTLADVTVYGCCITGWIYLLCMCVIWVSFVAALYYLQWYFFISEEKKKTGWACFSHFYCILFYTHNVESLLVMGLKNCWWITWCFWNGNVPSR